VATTLDLARLRRDTPASERLIHFNNAGAALMPNPVTDALYAHLDLERRIGGYEAAAAMSAELDDFYDAFATLLNADRDEIAYVENATRAWDMAVYALPFDPGDEVLVHASDYASNHFALTQLAARRGIRLVEVPSDAMGVIDVAALEAHIGSRTRAIALTHAPTHNGLIHPAEAVGAIARRHGLWYILDACQSAGQVPLDVKTIGCHILSGTGRKYLRGPRGTGFLYVERALLRTLEPPFVDLHSAASREGGGYTLVDDARRFECWESYVAGRLGLRAAVRYLLELGVTNIATRIATLGIQLRRELATVTGVTVHDVGSVQGGIVTFSVAGETALTTSTRLRALGMNTSVTGPAAAPNAPQWRRTPDAVRASVHAYNLEEEIGRFVAAVGHT
jgi:selenocysteine lyase/cysteine desulfurase